MKLIVGLGNPGIFYRNSRHNIGFSVIKNLGKKYRVNFRKEKGIPALTARINPEDLMLAMPLTFMNLSGEAVSRLVERYGFDLEDILVVCDDLDLEAGRLRLKTSGSSGGHRGLKSIISSLKSDGFSRLRIGIGKPAQSKDAAEYVLSAFPKKEKGLIDQIVQQACDCCLSWLELGAAQTMNTFNTRSQE